MRPSQQGLFLPLHQLRAFPLKLDPIHSVARRHLALHHPIGGAADSHSSRTAQNTRKVIALLTTDNCGDYAKGCGDGVLYSEQNTKSTIMVKIEGWLSVTLPGAKSPRRLFVVMEGYVMRVFSDEPLLTTAAALCPPLDLRRVTSVAPNDVYAPGLGPCTITGTHTVEMGCDPNQTIRSAGDDWWIRHVTSAVPDRAVAPSLRNSFREESLVLALIAQNASQPSAFGLTDKRWRKTSSKDLLTRKGSSGAPGASPPPKPALGKKAASAPATGVGVGARLEAARARRAAQDVNTGAEDADADAADVTDGGAGGQSPDDSSPSAASAEAPAPLPLQSAPASAVPRPAGESARRAALEAAAKGGSARAIAQLQQLEQQSPEQPEQSSQQQQQQQNSDRAGTVASPAVPQAGEECWFLRAGEGAAPSGPFTSREMKRRYLKGLVSHESLVRFLPGDAEAADVLTAAAQEDKAFAPLKELCTREGPPFMEQAAS